MANNFSLSRAARDLDVERLQRRNDDQVFADFLGQRYAANAGGPTCPYCKGSNIHQIKNREMLRCRPCRRQFSPRRGTIYYRSKLSLWQWDKIICAFVIAERGLVAKRLAGELRVQYKTAYRALQRIRYSLLPEMLLDRFARDIRSGAQEPMRHGFQFDGAEFGGHIRPKNVKKTETDHRKVPYRSSKDKEIGVVLVEPQGRVRIAIVKNEADAKALLRASAKKKTLAYCDFGSGWNDLGVHLMLKRVNHSREYATAEAHTNAAESFWALARSAERAHSHISGIHLASYLSELAWRRENRLTTNQGKYDKIFKSMMRSIPSPPKFNRNVKRTMKREGKEAEYACMRDAASAQARALAFQF